MKKFFITLLLATLFFVVLPKQAFADNNTEGAVCSISIGGTELSLDKDSFPEVYPIEFDGDYRVYSARVCGDIGEKQQWQIAVADIGYQDWDHGVVSKVPGTNCFEGLITIKSKIAERIWVDIEDFDLMPVCRRAYGRTIPTLVENVDAWDKAAEEFCNSVSLSVNPGFVAGADATVSYSFPSVYQGRLFKDPVHNSTYRLDYKFYREDQLLETHISISESGSSGSKSHKKLSSSKYSARLFLVHRTSSDDHTLDQKELCRKSFSIGTTNNPGEEDKVSNQDQLTDPFFVCNQAGSEASKALCEKCFNEQDGLWTAFGCVPYGKDGNFSSIIRAILQLGLGIGGGVVVLMVLAGGFILSTSQGDPKRVQEAKEMVTSAVMGLVFVIFSITILRFIGIQILQVPGFGN